MTWILKTIAPKSDQLNADDLMNGPIDVEILDVKRGSDEQQPVAIVIGDNRQPYKPCKSMRRVLVKLFGDEPQKWIGHRLRLFCDPNVQFGGVKVGGIRISHASIDHKVEIMLTVAKTKRAAFIVEPLPKVEVNDRVEKALAAIAKATTKEQIEKYREKIKSELLPVCSEADRKRLMGVLE